MALASSLPALRRSRRRCALLGGGLVLVLAGLAAAALPVLRPQPLAASHAINETVDPRLILRARTLPVAGNMSGGVRLAGTLYPALPGPNTLRLTVLGPLGAALRGARLSLVITMPGMAMAPLRAPLPARGQGYGGAVTLPMLGRYRAAVALTTPAGRYSGALTLAVPLPGQ
jgi:hypothetical protein